MREEIENWWKQAKADLHSAEHMFDSEDYYFSAFACQQAVEKGPKALGLIKLKTIPIGHSLVYLAKQLKLPQNFLKIYKA